MERELQPSTVLYSEFEAVGYKPRILQTAKIVESQCAVIGSPLFVESPFAT